MISKLKYLKGISLFNNRLSIWEKDSYLPSSWRPIYGKEKTKLRMRCFLTGRFRAVDKTYYLTRMPLKYFVKGGYLPGVKKASW